MLLQQIDSEIILALSNDGLEHNRDYATFRYVDDIILFANEQVTIEKIIAKYKLIGERYLLRLNELKLAKGETPCLPKEWLEKTRSLSDTIGNFFFHRKKSEYDELGEDERFIVKTDFISVDRTKDEITFLMKKYPEDRRTIVSFLLSTLLNNISKKKDGYTLFRNQDIDNNQGIGKALLLIDLAFFMYAFCPSFDQTRKLISMITYMNDEINFRDKSSAKTKLNKLINRYAFIFSSGNLFDLCDWFPFFLEYNIPLDAKTENCLIEKATIYNNPIIWANLLLYSKYYQPFFNDLKIKIEAIIEQQISHISSKDQLLQVEFWYVFIFHNCPYISGSLKAKMDALIASIRPTATQNPEPSSEVTELVCNFLQMQSSQGNKPEYSLFNWKGVKGFSEQITYRTYQRTIFKRYGKNNALYASID